MSLPPESIICRFPLHVSESCDWRFFKCRPVPPPSFFRNHASCPVMLSWIPRWSPPSLPPPSRLQAEPQTELRWPLPCPVLGAGGSTPYNRRSGVLGSFPPFKISQNFHGLFWLVPHDSVPSFHFHLRHSPACFLEQISSSYGARFLSPSSSAHSRRAAIPLRRHDQCVPSWPHPPFTNPFISLFHVAEC